MIRAFVDLGNNVALMILKDKLVAYYEDFDYHEAVLDRIYSRLQNLAIDEVIVVLHGIVCKQNTGHLKLHNLDVKESTNDYEAFKHLFGALGISKVFFYEFAGYYDSQICDHYLIIDQETSQCRLSVFDGNYKYSQLTSFRALEQNVQMLCNKYSIQKIVDAKNFVVPQLLEYYDNLKHLPKELYARFSLFAFTLTQASNDYLIKINLLSAANVSKQTVNLADKQDSGVQEEQSEVQEKQLKVKKSLGNKKKKKKGFPGFLAVMLSLICIGGSAGSAVGVQAYSKILNNDIECLSALNSQLLTETSQVDAYKRVINYNTNNPSESTDSLINVLTNINFNQGTNFIVEMKEDGLSVSALFKTKKAAKKFLESLSLAIVTNIKYSTIEQQKSGFKAIIEV